MRTLKNKLTGFGVGKALMALAAVAMVVAVTWSAVAGGLGRVVVTSSPSGAQVLVRGQVVGTTPAKLQLPEGSKVRLTVKKKGYTTRTVTLTPKADKVRNVKVTLKPSK